MIFESFENWREKPISTTIETLPISEITFPNVTVCPPKDLFLNLNQDIRKSEKVKLTEDLRNELIDFARDVIQDQYYNEVMTNLSKFQDPDRYYNWYHGYTELTYPHYRTYDNTLREAFKKENHKTYGKFHMFGGGGQAGSFSICFNHFTKTLLREAFKKKVHIKGHCPFLTLPFPPF